MRFIISVLTFFVACSAAAKGLDCDSLNYKEQQLAEKILASEYLYECCDQTIESCLKAEPTCFLALRLEANICRRVKAGQNEADIRRALSRRARSMIGGGEPATIDLSEAPIFGRDDARVTIVIYACARCPYCAKLVPKLYESIANGELSTSARLAFRTFPIRGHEASTEAGLAFTAAYEMHQFWPFMLYSYSHFENFSLDAQSAWAEEIGLNPLEFTSKMNDPATREALVTSKKEGLVNHVEETPTIFLNGRRWAGDLEIAELIDASLEEAARIKGEIWLTKE